MSSALDCTQIMSQKVTEQFNSHPSSRKQNYFIHNSKEVLVCFFFFFFLQFAVASSRLQRLDSSTVRTYSCWQGLAKTPALNCCEYSKGATVEPLFVHCTHCSLALFKQEAAWSRGPNSEPLGGHLIKPTVSSSVLETLLPSFPYLQWQVLSAGTTLADKTVSRWLLFRWWLAKHNKCVL